VEATGKEKKEKHKMSSLDARARKKGRGGTMARTVRCGGWMRRGVAGKHRKGGMGRFGMELRGTSKRGSGGRDGKGWGRE